MKLRRNTWTCKTETFLEKPAFALIHDDKGCLLDTAGTQPALMSLTLSHHYSFHVYR